MVSMSVDPAEGAVRGAVAPASAAAGRRPEPAAGPRPAIASSTARTAACIALASGQRPARSNASARSTIATTCRGRPETTVPSDRAGAVALRMSCSWLDSASCT